jgi:hypothetical protein
MKEDLIQEDLIQEEMNNNLILYCIFIRNKLEIEKYKRSIFKYYGFIR